MNMSIDEWFHMDECYFPIMDEFHLWFGLNNELLDEIHPWLEDK
jgi:hypothetical protein